MQRMIRRVPTGSLVITGVSGMLLIAACDHQQEPQSAAMAAEEPPAGYQQEPARLEGDDMREERYGAPESEPPGAGFQDPAQSAPQGTPEPPTEGTQPPGSTPPGGTPPPGSTPPAEGTQPPAPQGSMPAPQTGGQTLGAQVQVDDDLVKAFAEAYVRVIQVQQHYQRELQTADPAQAQTLQQQANAEMTSAVETQDGISVEQFQQLQTAMGQDPELRQRVETAIQDLAR